MDKIKITGNEPAYATPDNGTESFTTWYGQKGLTIRQHFAALAMQGLLANPEHRKIYKGQSYLMETGIYAEQAVKLADALIEELNK